MGMTKEAAFAAAGTKLSFDEMSAISGLRVEYLRALVQHGQLNMDLVACDKPRMLPIHPDPQMQRELMKRFNKDHPHGGYVPSWDVVNRKQVFTEWWHQHPAGKRRILSAQHRREMNNLVRGFPANYQGPTDGAVILTDEHMADIDHSLDKGKSLNEAVAELPGAGKGADKYLEKKAKAGAGATAGA